jgi:hypothetical protein
MSKEKGSGRLKVIVAYATIAGVLIALLGFLFGEGILSPKKQIVIKTAVKAQSAIYEVIGDHRSDERA